MDRKLEMLQHEIVEWADAISPGRRPENTVVKLVSESSELLDAIVNGKRADAVEDELGDCIILLLDLADMYGVDIIKAGYKKMDVNRKREWTVDGNVIRRKINGHDPA